MFRLDVRDRIHEVAREVRALGDKHLPAVTISALNWTGYRVREAEYASMRAVFDRPTPFTLRSLYVTNARLADPAVTVWLKEKYPEHYLSPQIYGGKRAQKRSERHLERAGLTAGRKFYVPGGGARLDKYGNLSRGQLVQILSALKALPDPLQHRSASVRSQRKARKANFFVMARKRGGLLPGVYQRFSGGSAKPVLLFIDAPDYKPRLPFFRTAERTASLLFPQEFERSLRKLIGREIR